MGLKYTSYIARPFLVVFLYAKEVSYQNRNIKPLLVALKS